MIKKIIAISALLLGLFISTPAQAATVTSVANGSYQSVDTWPVSVPVVFGSQGTGNGQFGYPARGIKTDANGRIYVVDTSNHRIQRFSAAGVYQTQFGGQGTGNGKFDQPADIAIDSIGNIYVVDANNNRVQKFNSAGVYQSQFGTAGSGNGQFNQPLSIAIDSSNNIYVGDYGNRRVQKFNSAGVYQSKFGSMGSGDGQFAANGVQGIAIAPNGDIVVMDLGNFRAQIFSSAGVFKSKFGTEGTGDGQFMNASKLAIDASGDIYVADTYNNRIQRFDSNGTFKSKFGTYGLDTGKMNTPFAVYVNAAGAIFVVDTGNFRVQKFAYSIPKNADSVVVDNNITLDQDVTVKDLTINSGKTLDLNGHAIQVNGIFILNGAVVNNGGAMTFGAAADIQINAPWSLGGDASVRDASFPTANPVQLNGFELNVRRDLTSAAAFDLAGGSVTFSDISDVTIKSPSYFTVGKDTTLRSLVIEPGASFDLNGKTLTVAKDWTNNQGAFYANSGTVIFTGVRNIVKEAYAFYNVVKTETSTSTLSIPESMFIDNDLTLSGVSGNLLKLNSSTGSNVDIAVGGTANVSFVQIIRVNNAGANPITCTSCTNQFNNTGWILQ